MMNGIWGTIAVGLLANPEVPGYSLVDQNGDQLAGLFYGGGFGLLGRQLTGFVAIAVFTAISMAIVFYAIKKTIGLRASEQEEIIGLDVTEHGLISSYADFAPALTDIGMKGYTKDDAKSVKKVGTPGTPAVPVDKAVEVENYSVHRSNIQTAEAPAVH